MSEEPGGALAQKRGIGAALGALAVIALAAACGDGDTAAGPPATTVPPTTGTSAPKPQELPSDLRNVLLPPGVCSSDAPAVQLADGSATNSSEMARDKWGSPEFSLYVQDSPSQVRHDFDGDGEVDLAFVLSCEGYGGTNAAFVHVVVVAADDTGLELLGDLEPDRHGDEAGVGGASVEVRNGRLRSADDVYQGDDARCCPTGTGYTEWRWTGADFVQEAASP